MQGTPPLAQLCLTLPQTTFPPSFSAIWHTLLKKSKVVKTKKIHKKSEIPCNNTSCKTLFHPSTWNIFTKFQQNPTYGFGEVQNSKNKQKFYKKIKKKLQHHLLNKLRSRDPQKCPYAISKQLAKWFSRRFFKISPQIH